MESELELRWKLGQTEWHLTGVQKGISELYALWDELQEERAKIIGKLTLMEMRYDGEREWSTTEQDLGSSSL